MDDYASVSGVPYGRDSPPSRSWIYDYIRNARPSWFALGACRNHPEINWFPGQGEPAAPAKAICASCPVRIACLNHALRAGEKIGVWGGTSERQRVSLRRSTWLTTDESRGTIDSVHARDDSPLTKPQLAVLSAAAFHFDAKGGTSTQVCDVSGCSMTAYLAARKVLEAKGLIDAQRIPGEGNKVWVAVTKEGWAELERLEQSRVRQTEEIRVDVHRIR